MLVRCIYCLEEKPAAAFKGREHVMPQAFGVFDTKNLVLKCVCDDCNNYFGREIDRKLAQDSAEAIDRINLGIKAAKDFQSLGRRSTSHIEVMEGPLAGGLGYAVANRDGGDDLGVIAFPQIWFGKSADGPFERFLIENVPTKDELVAKGYEVGSTLHIKTFEVVEPFQLLEAKGFNFADAQKEFSEPAAGRVRIENVTRIAEPEFRAVAKTALNYLAAVLGSELALDPAFDKARNFARYGKERGRVRVYPYENLWFKGRKGHYVSLTRSQDMVVAQLSILMRTQYFVVLAEDAASLPVLSSAHLFDLEAKRMKDFEPLPLTPGWALKPLKG